jgi:predicted DNA-binding transcriptional regulator AlpA
VKWIRTAEVAEKLAISTSGLKALMDRDVDFPKPMRVSERHIVFDEEAIERWMRSKMLTSTQEV